ncbi:unnamed protein product [Caenorhabditis bovis]|uniref:cystathionine beta-synthase n=1 Tax=Caenorhabditis bovis TaxID=2654633 RepID=A0A8S1FAZ9_9PELO|nr:unnamed protein product [Caenorhabditis bovis]
MNNTTDTEDFVMEHTTSEIIEICYQLSFLFIGTPINIYALFRTSRNVREGGVESRLVRLSRQLLIAHLLVLLVYGIWRTYWLYNIVWLQGDFLCKVYSFLCALPFHLWSNMVAAITVDMLCCITSPLSSYRTGANRVSWLIALSWIFAIICSIPMAILRGTVRISSTEPYEQCYAHLEAFGEDAIIAFHMFHVLTTFYIPLLIVIICYLLIGLSIKKQMAERRLLHDGGQAKKNSNTKARFLRTTIAIICTFFFTWLPYQVLALLRVVCDNDKQCEHVLGKLNWLQAIIIASTCINPFLYRFGVEPKRASYYCSTVDTGKEEAGQFAGRQRANAGTRTLYAMMPNDGTARVSETIAEMQPKRGSSPRVRRLLQFRPTMSEAQKGRTFETILEAAEWPTPLVPLKKIKAEHQLHCDIYVKLEYLNVAGSLSDRAAIKAFEMAYEMGLAPGDEVVLTSGGSTAVSYATVAAVKGNNLTVYTPKKGTELVQTILDSLGAKTIHLDVESFSEARALTDEAAQQSGAFNLNKYATNATFVANMSKTACEIENAVGKKLIRKVNAVVLPMNTGVAAAGISAFYKGIGEHGVRVVGVTCKENKIPEMGSDLKEGLLKEYGIEQREVDEEETYRFTRHLISSEGVMAGPSSGAAVLAALKLAKELPAGSTIIVILMDGIRNYLRHFLDDDWVRDNKLNVDPRKEGPQPNSTFDPKVLEYDPTKLSGEWSKDENGKWTHSAIEFNKFNPERQLVFDTVLDGIGKTPLVKLQRIPKKHGVKCNVYVKCEYLNSGGSTKDRIAQRMIEIAEKTGKPGKLVPGVTLIEPTSGNTGIGLSLAAAVKGYKCIIVMPKKMSKEKALAMESLGSTIIRTPNEAGFDSPHSHIGVSLRLRSEIPDSVILDQYCNPGNPLAHYEQTAEEILYDMGDKNIDLVVLTAGTGGTVTGISRKIHDRLPNAKVVGVDPHGSVLAGPHQSEIDFYEVEGIGYDFLPGTLDTSVVDYWMKSHDKESFLMARELIQTEGILCGGSAGCAVHYALEEAKKLNLPETANVVVLLPDGIRNYLSRFLDNNWMNERHFFD